MSSKIEIHDSVEMPVRHVTQVKMLVVLSHSKHPHLQMAIDSFTERRKFQHFN